MPMKLRFPDKPLKRYKLGTHSIKSPFVKYTGDIILVPRGKYKTKLEALEASKYWKGCTPRIFKQKSRWLLYSE